MGDLPQVVFNGLYLDGGGTILTRVYEGENTRNGLLSAGHQTFLRSLPWDFSVYGYGPQDENLKNSYKRYEEELDFISRCEWVGKFIIDSQSKDSAISQYFSWLYQEAHKPENNRVVSSLSKAVNTLVKENKISIQNDDMAEPQVHSHLNQCGFFGQLSQTFRESVAKTLTATEKHILKACANVIKECPSYFPPDYPNYWQNQLKSQNDVCCSPLFFNINGHCYPQPLITASPGLTLPK